jgi:hypothetical protein
MVMGSIRIGSSLAEQTADAAADLARQLSGQQYALVIFFTADRHNAARLATEMRRHFPLPTAVIGCSTAGEIGLAGYQNDSLVAIGFPAADFTAATAVIPDLERFDTGECQRRIEDALRVSNAQRDTRGYTNTLAFVLIDGLSLREEPVGRAIQLLLGDIPLVGGSAGDSLHFRETLIFHGAEVVRNAAVVALISTDLPFRIVKTQHFERSTERMVVTGARPQDRVVTEINGFPAALEYARIVGIPAETLSPMAFAAYPVVVRIGGQEYVRSIQKMNSDHSLTFYCAIDEGIVLARARGIDPLENLEHALDAVAAEIGELQAVLACDCILRNLEFRQSKQIEIMSKALRERHVLGFSTFGELHMGVHMNQTFTGVAFGHRHAKTDASGGAIASS